jgi:hypothetical protein
MYARRSQLSPFKKIIFHISKNTVGLEINNYLD